MRVRSGPAILVAMADDPSRPDVDALVRAGDQAWPHVPLPGERFRAFVMERLETGVDPASLRMDDLYLACACAEGLSEAIAEVELQHFADIERALRRVLRSDPAVAECLQVLRYKLFVSDKERPRIATYAGKGALGGFLRATALRTAVDFQRSQGAVDRREGAELPEDVRVVVESDPEVSLIKRHHRSEFEGALAAALAELPPRDRNVLRLYTADGLSLEEIGRIYRVNRSTVSRWMGAIRGRVLGALRARFADGQSGTPRELESFFDLFRSGLDQSIGGLLGSSGSRPPGDEGSGG